MDPLSVAASIVGLLTATAKITTALASFTGSALDAPRLVRRVLSEVEDMTAVFERLQRFVLSPRGRTELVEVRQLVTTLTACVVIFSDLEGVVEGCKLGAGEMRLLDRIRWARRESEVRRMLADLAETKVSLTLMLSVVQCNSDSDAAQNVQELRGVVDNLVESNRTISYQLRTLMTRQEPPTDTSQPTIKWRPFEVVLHRTNVYRSQNLWKHSVLSLASSAIPRTCWTSLSECSLSEISRISVLSLPLYPADLYNATHYLGIVDYGDDADTAVTISGPSDERCGWSDSEDTAMDQQSIVTAPEEPLEPSTPEEPDNDLFGWGDAGAKDAVDMMYNLVYRRKVVSTTWTPVMAINIQLPVPPDSDAGGEGLRVSVPFPPIEESDETEIQLHAVHHYQANEDIWEQIKPIFMSMRRLQSLSQLVENIDPRVIEFVTTSVRYGISRLYAIQYIRNLSGYLKSLHDLLSALSITILYSFQRHTDAYLHNTAIPTLELQILLIATISNQICSTKTRPASSLAHLRTTLVTEERLLLSALFRLPDFPASALIALTDEEKVTFAAHFEYFWDQLRERPWTKPELVWDEKESCYIEAPVGAFEQAGQALRRRIAGLELGPSLVGWEWGKPWGRPQWKEDPTLAGQRLTVADNIRDDMVR